MIEVARLDAYREEIEAASSVRLAVMAGLSFVALFLPAMALASLWLSPGSSVPWLLLVIASATAGLVFGARAPSLLKRRLSRMAEAIYLGQPPYATEPPDARFTHRLPASLLAGRIAAGGVLYLTPGLATFVPHRLNLSRNRGSVVIADGTGCVVSVVPRSRSLLRSTQDTSRGVIQATSPLGSWTLYVPRPSVLLPQLEALLAQPRGGHP